jgi:hypothetical protein
MDDRQPDALTDAAIDREIRAALSVDPSPEFLARVRTRIASEPVESGFRWSWVPAGTVAALLMVAVVVSFSRQNNAADLKVGPTEVNTGGAPTGEAKIDIAESGPKMGITEPTGADLKGTTDTAPTASAVVPTFRSARAKESSIPEVLISPDDVLAFQQFITAIHQRRFEIVFDEPLAVTPSPQFSELTISPITIAPLEPTAPDEGVLQ